MIFNDLDLCQRMYVCKYSVGGEQRIFLQVEINYISLVYMYKVLSEICIFTEFFFNSISKNTTWLNILHLLGTGGR